MASRGTGIGGCKDFEEVMGKGSGGAKDCGMEENLEKEKGEVRKSRLAVPGNSEGRSGKLGICQI